MIYPYVGNFPYNKQSILNNAPDAIGIYFCGVINPLNGSLVFKYIGRAVGENVTIKSRLLNHLNDQDLSGIFSFGYRVCTSVLEAINQEEVDIKAWQPVLNERSK